MSSLVSCCRTDTGLSSGVHLGIARLNSKGGGGEGGVRWFKRPCVVLDRI